MVVFVVSGVVDSAATSANRTIGARYFWSNPNGSGNLNEASPNDAFVVLTPKLSQVKCVETGSAANAPFDLSESVDYIVQIKNTGTNLSTAYDISDISDTLITGTEYSSHEAYYCASGASTATCGIVFPL